MSECSSAVIMVYMLTSDHPESAKAIAKGMGIVPRNPWTLSAPLASSIVQIAMKFDEMRDSEIDALEELPLVITRCDPDTNTWMIEALRRRDAFMAMTREGVDDAPSPSRADVGAAMITGLNAAKSPANCPCG